MVISWLVSAVTFVVAIIIILTVAKVVCNKEKKPSELERDTRTCGFLFSAMFLQECYLFVGVSRVMHVFCYRCRQHICRLVSQQALIGPTGNNEGKVNL